MALTSLSVRMRWVGRAGRKVKCVCMWARCTKMCAWQDKSACAWESVRLGSEALGNESDIVKHITFHPLGCTSCHISPFYWSWRSPLWCNYTMVTRGLQTKAARCWRHREFILLSWQPECWWINVRLAFCCGTCENSPEWELRRYHQQSDEAAACCRL